MEVGKLYKVDGVVSKLDKIMVFSDGSTLFIFSNEEEEELMVTSYTKRTPSYYNNIQPDVTVFSNTITPFSPYTS